MCCLYIYIVGQFRRVLSQPGFGNEMRSWDDEIHCSLISTHKAHQRPINSLQCEGGRIVTGSQDHTLKVRDISLHANVHTHPKASFGWYS